MDERVMSRATDVEDADEEHDLIEEIDRDLHQVQALLEQLSATPGAVKGGSAEQRLARRSTVERIRAALAEQQSVGMQYLWPAVRKTLPSGERLAEMAAESNKRCRGLLTALGKVSPDDAEFDDLVEQLTLACRMHVVFKDQVLLQLGDLLSARERQRIGRQLPRRDGVTETASALLKGWPVHP
ncbi:MAG TPA: hypothetical protein VGK78_11210 [Nocardioides sp.]|uniref:hypothetical protein n=1 Tax=Nocardioides sp. TaxID=35761 RepID=UPI002F3F2EEE